MALDLAALHETRCNARQRLLASRTAAGYWEGELSSSALSTATAVFALSLWEREAASGGDAAPCRRLIQAGVQWLIRTQNADGGWGDTLRSISNISTTALCWAALAGVAGADAANEKAEAWLIRAAGSLRPEALARAITERYGRDRTFSVPILTMCALAGRLGKPADAWRLIPQLPFELAACPHQWFQWLKLPVVSYALPALIAMGQVRHRRLPSPNPAARGVRNLASAATLRVLQEIQPEGGGFLEATPLTSFVVMSMVGAGLARHPVVDEGIQFLIRSARPDGSWPIDTNLSTWVTTLSVNALAAGGALEEMLGADERRAIRDWLLGQQHRVEHPYTRAAPGGWAWTDLPGGVPDADDTPGALLALYHLNLIDAEVTAAAAAGVRWLLDLQNRDGGMPTFCRGWGALPFDRSGADLTAHVLHACSVWRPRLPPDLAARVQGMTTRALRYLATVQRADGAWTPLWFGNQFAPDDANPTYGTARVLLALADLPEEAAAQLRKGGQGWLLRAQNADGGWGGDQGVASTIEETALAVQALQAVGNCSEATAAIARGAAWLIAGTDCGLRVDASPIGFYFARLWYYEALYPSIFLAGALEQIGAAPHGG